MRIGWLAALLLAGVLPGAALAADDTATGKLLSGAAAFGGYQKDAPGITRHLTIKDQPPPDQADTAANAPDVVPMPAGAMPKVQQGFKVELVASGIRNPRAMRVAPNGDLFVADSRANRVLVYRIPAGDAKPEAHNVFATGLHQPYGINFYPPGPDPKWIYIANSNSVVRYPYKSGDLKAQGRPETVVADVPSTHHWTRDIIFTPDTKTMFLSVGSGSNDAEDMGKRPPGGLAAWTEDHPLGEAWGSEMGRAAVWALTPDGKDKKIYATGLRNCAGMTLQPATEQLWCVVNERDMLGNNVPFEYATAVKEGGWYGWPWYYLGGHEDPGHAGARPDLAGKLTLPDVLMQAHSAPLNIAFYEGDQFPPEYKGDAFVALHGSWNRSDRTGYKVVRLLFKDGKPTGEYQDFVTGFVQPNGAVWGRPVGLAVGKDGSLFVSEDGNGTIWRVTYGG
ncbi:MAG TPA: sorbosone dehydrogenase family protein [Devosiaceae bacterium]|nr:sorbosone dehydrogenase family protein [Devosiaceae bacterium]